ncbi:MAG: formyltransferase family protein [Dehalococcoidia bacterium]
MYGREIHKKVIESGHMTTGATIHYVESNYDSGQIIQQMEIAVSSSDSIDSLEEKVKFQEKRLYINSINKIINHSKP